MKSLYSMGNAMGSFISKGYQKMKGAFVTNKEFGEEKYLQKDEDIDLNQCDGDLPAPSSEEAITDFENFYPGYLTINADEILQICQQWKKTNTTEVIRWENAHVKGGMACLDIKSLRKMRGIGKELIIEFGKRILSGQFNLTKIPFPIKCMVPQSVLEKSVHGSCLLPMYMGLASLTEDPVERFKFVIASMVGTFYWTNNFKKPLNPILGETLEAKYNDGSEVYSEQISHHPPISYFLVIGPNKFYQYSGYYNYEVKAGINSITILNTGRRCIKFRNGQTIYFNFTNGYYFRFIKNEKNTILELYLVLANKIVMASCNLWILITIFAQIFNLANLKNRGSYGQRKKALQDSWNISWFTITQLYKLNFNQGYLNFDNDRYWNYKDIIPCLISMNQLETTLPSDHLKRQDLKLLKECIKNYYYLLKLQKDKISEAQKAKNELEDIQRSDRNLRAKYEKDKLKNGKSK